MIGEEILKEIDRTLDQLIQNATAIDCCRAHTLDLTEQEAFEKTQESLLAHLIHMDEKLAEKREKLKTPKKGSAQLQIQQKLLQLEKLQESQTTAMRSELALIKKHYYKKKHISRWRKRPQRKKAS